MRLLNMMQAKESGQAVERVAIFAKVYMTKDGHPISDEVRDKIVSPMSLLNISFVFCA